MADANEPIIQQSLAGGIARITLNRPDRRNALTREMIERLTAAVDQFGADSSLRALVLQAAGSVFCAGMDLGEMQQRAVAADAVQQWQRDSEVYGQLLIALHSLPVPTVAVVGGPVLAGGVGLVCACDVVVASENAFFALPEPARGLTAAMVTPLLLHRVAGGAARHLLLSGERIGAQRALAIGLCNDVVAAEALDARIQSLLGDMLSGAPQALAISKAHLARCSPVDINQQVRMSIKASAAARQTEDSREGLAAFLEKRKPRWQPE